MDALDERVLGERRAAGELRGVVLDADDQRQRRSSSASRPSSPSCESLVNGLPAAVGRWPRGSRRRRRRRRGCSRPRSRHRCRRSRPRERRPQRRSRASPSRPIGGPASSLRRRRPDRARRRGSRRRRRAPPRRTRRPAEQQPRRARLAAPASPWPRCTPSAPSASAAPTSSLTTKVGAERARSRCPRATTSAVGAFTRSCTTVAPAATRAPRRLRGPRRSRAPSCEPRPSVERARVERGERVVERDVERARPLRARRGVLAGDAEGGERLGGRLERIVGATARKQPVIAVDMQPGAGDRREQRIAVRDARSRVRRRTRGRRCR